MKRDMDLIRDILLRMEEHDFASDADSGSNWRLDKEFEGHSEAEVMYHIGLLYKAGFIEAYDASTAREDYYEPSGITWQGHEFIDAARNQTVWNGAKEAATKYGGSLPLEVMKAVLIKGASQFLGLG